MKLKDFIKDLEEIVKKVDKPDRIEIEMADCIPVVKPIFLKNTVYITDVDPKEE